MSSQLIIRYILFYLSVVFFFAFYSVILDEIFFKLDYGKSSEIISSFFYYSAYLIIVGFPIALPLIIFYNWFSINAFENLKYKSILRMVFGIFIGLMIGLVAKRGIDSFYIGKMRSLKMTILFPFVGFSAELLRIFVNSRKWGNNKSLTN